MIPASDASITPPLLSASILPKQIQLHTSSKIKEFFYEIENIIHHIKCERSDTADFNTEHNNSNVFVFICHHQQLDTKKTYRYKLTCSKLSNIFINQYLNKILYNLEFDQLEHLEFSENDKIML